MKVRFKVSDRFEVEAEGANHKELWTEMSALGELFSPANSICGVCGGKEVRPVVRDVSTGEGKKKEEYTYFEMHCQNTSCRARMAFGCSKTGNALFPKKKDEEGKWLPNNGWAKYEKPQS